MIRDSSPAPVPSFKLANFTIGDLLVCVGLFLAGIGAYYTLKADLALANERITVIGAGQASVHSELIKHIAEETKTRDAVRMEIRNDLILINNKLDKIIERELHSAKEKAQ